MFGPHKVISHLHYHQHTFVIFPVLQRTIDSGNWKGIELRKFKPGKVCSRQKEGILTRPKFWVKIGLFSHSSGCSCQVKALKIEAQIHEYAPKTMAVKGWQNRDDVSKKIMFPKQKCFRKSSLWFRLGAEFGTEAKGHLVNTSWVTILPRLYFPLLPGLEIFDQTW